MKEDIGRGERINATRKSERHKPTSSSASKYHTPFSSCHGTRPAKNNQAQWDGRPIHGRQNFSRHDKSLPRGGRRYSCRITQGKRARY